MLTNEMESECESQMKDCHCDSSFGLEIALFGQIVAAFCTA